MIEYTMAVKGGRTIPKEDKIFGISNRANAMIAEKGKDAVINATIGALLDDDGNLMVLSSVDETFRSLKPAEYAAYAPIAGIPDFRKAAIKAALGKYEPKAFVEAVATPGGTGSIRNTIANYSERGDKVLTSDWFWSPYKTIASEIGRDIDTFTLFTEDRKFNIGSFDEKVNELLATQEYLTIILNTPAHNPTGYSLTIEDWEGVVDVLNKVAPEKKIALLIDAAYIDFAGDEDKYREFLPVLEGLPVNVLPIIAYSMSKTFTAYGMRCGAMVCLAPTEAIAKEFKSVCEFSSRGSWSNCSRAGQSVIAKIYSDEELLARVTQERKEIRDMLLRRGKAFEEEANKIGLVTVPFDAGFFVSIPCDNPDEIASKLEKEGLFIIPLAKGVRVSVASVSEEKCRVIPAKILNAMK
ncbi:MAG: aminotransferase class I/II-fold pyridoxal phosphate-dependent enzyme [Eubacteriaceae bacterium]|nr:aminotransferase class I/II-fold pyridoxal phosphate-dependent enzyme [Eubacteriaceae bacterium]